VYNVHLEFTDDLYYLSSFYIGIILCFIKKFHIIIIYGEKKSMIERGGEHPIPVCVVYSIYTQQRWRLQNFNNDVLTLMLYIIVGQCVWRSDLISHVYSVFVPIVALCINISSNISMFYTVYIILSLIIWTLYYIHFIV